MESKWFTETPESFDSEWSVVVCPVGQRCLVMAIDGETKWFNKKCFKLPGYFLSVLPGGNGYEYGYGPTAVTMLDCVYNEEMMTYFILDCILWDGQDLKEIEYTERLKIYKREIIRRPEFKNITDLNMFKFVPLYNYDCTLEGLDKALRYSTFEIDGLLFYKNDVKYVSGPCEDILWTKPYVLPDIFDGIAVPKNLMEQKPESYKDFESFVDDVKNGRIKEKKKKKKKNNKEFVPQVQLNLPPQRVSKDEKKNNNKKEKRVGQYSYYGPGEGFRSKGGRVWGRGRDRGSGGNNNRESGQGDRQGYMGGNRPGGRGGSGDSYGRVLASAGGDTRRRVYGEGTVSGYPYYGDDRDLYYPQSVFPGSEARRIRGKQQDSFGMSDMNAALNYYEHENGRKANNRRHYKLF